MGNRNRHLVFTLTAKKISAVNKIATTIHDVCRGKVASINEVTPTKAINGHTKKDILSCGHPSRNRWSDKNALLVGGIYMAYNARSFVRLGTTN